jgi:outer membrane protein OmpA-like peptidoglycan-associated protein
VLFTCLLTAQEAPVEKNLVPNGGFENYKRKSSSIKAAIPWQQIASVDYYLEPLANDTSRFKGARTGSGYAGLRYQKKYKEFLQVKLAEPLKRGAHYQFEMWVRLGFWSNATLKSIGVHFSKAGYQGLGTLTKSNLIDTTAKKGGGFYNEYGWFRVSGIYIADGGEKFITIGNFSENIRKDMVKDHVLKMGFKEAYYFVDDVSLKRVKVKGEEVKTVIVGSSLDEKEDSVLEVKKDIKVGDRVTLKNINFENGHYYITPESYGELNKLVQYMLRHPGMEIRINGHSDNSGSARKNLKLSEQRARTVFEYLISKGVQNKMYFKGFGDTQPIATNDTDVGRALNRRVEFEIIKQ